MSDERKPSLETIYRHIRGASKIGDEIDTDVHPWLIEAYGMDGTTAARVRRWAMRELERRGLTYRDHQGCKLRILADWPGAMTA